MCFFSQPSSTPAPVTPPPPAAAPPAAQNPVLSNSYDPSSPEGGVAAEKGSAMAKAKGTSQLKVDLDPTLAGMDNQTGLQINT